MDVPALKRTLLACREASGDAKLFVLRAGDSSLLRRVLLYTYDTMTRVYGVKQLVDDPQASTWGSGDVGPAVESFFEALDKCSSGEFSGNVARDAVSRAISWAYACDREAAKWLALVVSRDLDIGVAAKTINKAFPNLIPTFDVMLAQTVDMAKLQYPCGLQVKLDGKRCIAVMAPGQPVRLFSRNGKEITGYDKQVKELEAWRNAMRYTIYGSFDGVLDGELMFGMFGDRSEHAATAKFMVYDWLEWSEWTSKKAWKTQVERSDWLDKWLGPNGSWSWSEYDEPLVGRLPFAVANNRADVEQLYNDVVSNGGEGVMLKKLNAKYEFKRSSAWLKLKPELDGDFRVVGFFEGEGKYVGMLGGLVVHVDGVEVRVGSGFSDALRAEYWDRREQLVGMVAEVLYTEKTPDGSLRFPRFRKIRDDKDAD